MTYTTLETVTVERPEDATHFCQETDSDWACWYKKTECGHWSYMYADAKAGVEPLGEWRYNSQVDEDTLLHMIEL
ncbi:hypothetical protein [Vibrio phage P23]|nr:hypothetical protein [Vibrio phage P23]